MSVATPPTEAAVEDGSESTCVECGKPICYATGPGWWHWETDTEDCSETLSFYQRLLQAHGIAP